MITLDQVIYLLKPGIKSIHPSLGIRYNPVTDSIDLTYGEKSQFLLSRYQIEDNAWKVTVFPRVRQIAAHWGLLKPKFDTVMPPLSEEPTRSIKL